MSKKKLLQIGSFVVVWITLILFFWLSSAPDDAMGFSLLAFYIVMPITTIIISLLIGLDKDWGKGKWAIPPLFGFLYMLAEYLTFSLSNTFATGNLNQPEYIMLLSETVFSFVWILIGVLKRKSQKIKECEH